MTATWLWFCAWLSTFCVLLLACTRIETLLGEREADEQAMHARCIAHIAAVTSNRVIALWLLQAADRWDSVEERANLDRLAREKYEVGGPSMPAIWMRTEAERLDPNTQGEEAVA